jgi:MSHA biogenesis protein MshN
MSLINEMLRDLETRRAGELGKPDLQREIRPLPEGRRSFPLRQIAVTGLLVALGGATWWWASLWQEKQILPEVAAVPVAPALPAPVPAEISPGAVTEALRLAVELSNPPNEPLRSPGSKAPIQQESRQPDKPSAVKVDPQPVKAASAQDAVPGNIEKTVVLGTPRERADAEYRRAQSLLGSGGSMAAVADILRGALKQDGSYAPARQLLLKILLESRRGDEAVALLQEGLENQPGQVGWAMSLARLQVDRSEVNAAERTLARFAAYGAGSAEYAGFHGHLLNRLGQHREAAEQYLAATRIAPADGRWWFGLGQALEGGGRGEEARSAFRRALEAGNLNADLMALAEQKLR